MVYWAKWNQAVSYTVTFKVVNGKWDNNTGADKTVTLSGYEGDTLKLTADQIPAVGTKPNDTFKAGSWNTTPSKDTAITAATTYTYTYMTLESAPFSSDLIQAYHRTSTKARRFFKLLVQSLHATSMIVMPFYPRISNDLECPI